MATSRERVLSGLDQVRERIANAARTAGRRPDAIRLIAVSKRQDVEAIRTAFTAGQTAFGENYVQEALEKQAQLADLPIEWHYIGRIQGNKTRAIAEHFHWVHTLADPAHARRLSAQRPTAKGPLKCCIQVNLDDSPTKGGVTPRALPDLLAACTDLPGIRVVGLMTLPEPVQGLAQQRVPFRTLQALRERVASPELTLPELSIGMTADLEAAIMEGATLVRIGTAVFGPRPYNTGPSRPDVPG